MRSKSKQLDISMEEYIEQTKKALLTSDSVAPGFQYEVDISETCSFSWKKVLIEEGMTVKKFHPTNFKSFCF